MKVIRVSMLIIRMQYVEDYMIVRNVISQIILSILVSFSKAGLFDGKES